MHTPIKTNGIDMNTNANLNNDDEINKSFWAVLFALPIIVLILRALSL